MSRHNRKSSRKKPARSILPYILSAASCVAGKACEAAWQHVFPSAPPIIIQASR